MKKIIVLSIILILFTACTSTDSNNKEKRKETFRLEIKQVLKKLQQEYASGNIDAEPSVKDEDAVITPTPCKEYMDIKEEDASCMYTYEISEENGETKAKFSVELWGNAEGEYSGLHASLYDEEEPTVGEIAPIE